MRCEAQLAAHGCSYLGEDLSDFHENFTTDVSLDRKVPVKFWKSSRSGVRIRSLDPDQIRLGGVMRSLRALVLRSVIDFEVIIGAYTAPAHERQVV